MTDLPTISSDESWKESRFSIQNGEQATIEGRLTNIYRNARLAFDLKDLTRVTIPVVGESPMGEIGLDRLRAEGLGRPVRLVVMRRDEEFVVDAGALLGAEIL